ncbi:MAG: hypothetical protein J6Q67_00895 [Clostridia bacterium]|nr:hypothetical protein [Clostridia bacterium]
MDKRKIIYYEDELSDEFSVVPLEKKIIDESYVYVKKSLFKRFTRFFWYRIIATPIAFLYTKLRFGHKVVGAKKMKPYKKSGIFMYGNHTQDIGDAFIPNMIYKSKGKYVVVNPSNLCVPVIGHVVPSLGGLPLPGCPVAAKNFLSAIKERISEGAAVVIYPEAHIWPYYTGIRPFTDDSFIFPIRLGAAVFCFTNTYRKRKIRKEPKIITYVDGPFFADEKLPLRERRADLRNRVYEKMSERAGLSDVEIIKYVKKEKDV